MKPVILQKEITYMLIKTDKPKPLLHLKHSGCLMKYTGTEDNNKLFLLTRTFYQNNSVYREKFLTARRNF